jgi:pilus assembly protein Flp/PilA
MLTQLFVKTAAIFADNKQYGVTAIEYAMIGVIISGIVLVVFTDSALQSSLSGALSTISSNISKANGS